MCASEPCAYMCCCGLVHDAASSVTIMTSSGPADVAVEYLTIHISTPTGTARARALWGLQQNGGPSGSANRVNLYLKRIW